jgi:DegV family protein with EDD domain
VPGIRVVTDSACDLPQDIATELEIDIVPLTIRFGNEELVDRRDLSPKEFWARVATSPVLPETAAPSPGAFEEAFRRAAAAGADGVVCVTLSGGLSATYESARVAAKSVADDIDVQVIDSRMVTMAQGLMAIGAARAAKQGKNLDECVAVVEDLKPRTRLYGAIDTLEHLKKGGRIGGAQALLGSMLSIKPIIELKDGKVEPESRQRTRSKALRYLVEKVREASQVEDLVMMHGDAHDADELLDLLGAVYPRDEIMSADIGPVIGTHAGPGVIGVVFHVAR